MKWGRRKEKKENFWLVDIFKQRYNSSYTGIDRDLWAWKEIYFIFTEFFPLCYKHNRYDQDAIMIMKSIFFRKFEWKGLFNLFFNEICMIKSGSSFLSLLIIVYSINDSIFWKQRLSLDSTFQTYISTPHHSRSLFVLISTHPLMLPY